MNEPTSRRRFRFGLRTLIAGTTLVAVAAWTYSVGWPWGKATYEQLRFESIAKRLTAGVTPAEVWMRVGKEYRASSTFTTNANFVTVGMMRFKLANSVYFVCYEYPKGYSGLMLNGPSARVEVYRLPLPPRDYGERRSSSVRSESASEANNNSADPSLDAYTSDFHEYYLGDHHNTFGLQIERIHADPPTSKNAQ
jgi:hypothetical protein